MESIVARNLEIYSDMQQQLYRFKKLLKEEEEAHQKVRSTFYYWCIKYILYKSQQKFHKND